MKTKMMPTITVFVLEMVGNEPIQYVPTLGNGPMQYVPNLSGTEYFLIGVNRYYCCPSRKQEHHGDEPNYDDTNSETTPSSNLDQRVI
jgi:hypothetical protein